jgi:hypothetical protein
MVKSNGNTRQERKEKRKEEEKKEFQTVAHRNKQSDCRCVGLEEEKKEFQTVGEASLALSQRDQGNHTTYDQGTESLKHIDKNFSICVENHINKWHKDFYVVKYSRRDGYLVNVVDNRYLAHKDCPLPTFNQTVWKYHRGSGKIEELWVLPSEYDTIEMYANRDLTFDWEWPQLKHVIKYWDGGLTKLAEEEKRKNNLGDIA